MHSAKPTLYACRASVDSMEKALGALESSLSRAATLVSQQMSLESGSRVVLDALPATIAIPMIMA